MIAQHVRAINSIGRQHGTCVPNYFRSATLLHPSKYHNRAKRLHKIQHGKVEADRGKDTPEPIKLSQSPALHMHLLTLPQRP